MNNTLVAYVGAIVAIVSLVGLLFAAGQSWGDLKARVSVLERQGQYLYGSIHLPEGVK